MWIHPHCSCLGASKGRIRRRVHENGARALVPSWDVYWEGLEVGPHNKAGAVGCLERGCFGDQFYCTIPLLVGMPECKQAGLRRMPIMCGHKIVGSPWERAGGWRGMDTGARGMLEEAA